MRTFIVILLMTPTINMVTNHINQREEGFEQYSDQFKGDRSVIYGWATDSQLSHLCTGMRKDVVDYLVNIPPRVLSDDGTTCEVDYLGNTITYRNGCVTDINLREK